MGRSVRVRSIAPWLAVAMLGAVAGLLLTVLLSAFRPESAVVVREGAGTTESVAAVETLPGAALSAARRDEPAVGSASTETESPSASGMAGPPPSGPSDASDAVDGLRLSIPSLNVDAAIVDLGFDDDGRLDVPGDGGSIGWYHMTPQPGEPGNSLLGGHYDWDGSLAVFWRLSELDVGDRVEIDDGSGNELVYEVQSTSDVDWDRPLSEILGTDESGSSLTLFTCGGDFDQERGEYAQRTVVWATLVEPSALTSRR